MIMYPLHVAEFSVPGMEGCERALSPFPPQDRQTWAAIVCGKVWAASFGRSSPDHDPRPALPLPHQRVGSSAELEISSLFKDCWQANFTVINHFGPERSGM